MTSVVRFDGDWTGTVDTIYERGPSDQEWVSDFLERAAGLFPHDATTLAYVLEHAGDWQSARITAMATGGEDRSIRKMLEASFASVAPTWFQSFHFHVRPVTIITEILRELDPAAMGEVREFMLRLQTTSATGVVTHPEPGRVVVLAANFRRHIALSLRERRALTRLALHVESGFRLCHRPDVVKAVLQSDGALVHREADAPPPDLLEDRARRFERAHHERGLPASELWPALVDGRLSLVARGRGKARRLYLLENAPALQRFRALSSREVDVVERAARGLSTKELSFALGVATSRVSSALSSAAAKIGALSRNELVRVAAMLTRDPRAGLPTSTLSAAEREVLELLHEGLSNAAIARMRHRSVRTIANQVASLLRKTGASSRRELATMRLPPSSPAVTTGT